MKKILLFILLLIPFNVFAATGSIKASTSSTKVTLNNTFTVKVTVSSTDTLGSWEYNLNYDKSKLSIQSGQTDLTVREWAREGNSKSKTYTYKFKAIATGNANITIDNAKIGDWDTVQYIKVTTSNLSISIKEPVIINYSSDNNLKALSIDGFEISPEFSKSNLAYNATVDSNTTKIKINATSSDNKAKVSGTGEFEVSEGSNSFSIVVTAENGTTKTYTLNVVVPEKDPIKHVFRVDNGNIDKKAPKNAQITYGYKTEEFSILRKLPESLPFNFTSSTIKFGEEEVPVMQNEKLNLTLLYLRNKDNKDAFYIYNKENDSVTLYNEVVNNELHIYLEEPTKSIDNLIPVKVKINGEELNAYQIREKSKDYIVYGTNIVTGEKAFYVYDKDNQTISLFNSEDLDYIYKDISFYKMICYVLVGLLFLSIIIIILINKSKRKLNKMVNKMIEEKETSIKQKKSKK